MAAKRTTVPETPEPVVDSTENSHDIKPVDGKLEYTVTSMMKINYGDYEAHHVFAAVKGTYASDVDIDALAANLDEKVFSLMNPQLEAALPLSIKESFVRKLG